MKFKIAVFASGNGTVLQSIMDQIKSGELANVELCVLVSNKECPAVERAKNAGYKTMVFSGKGKTREEFDAEISQAIKIFDLDLIVLAGYMRILSDAFVKEYENKIINVHPSLLPDFAGGMDLEVHKAVLEAGVSKTGCTVHFVNENVDAGEILLQKEVAVSQDETPESLKAKVQALEYIAVPEAIRLVQSKMLF